MTRGQSQDRSGTPFYSDKIPKRLSSHWPQMSQGVDTRDPGISPRAAAGLWGIGEEM